MVFQELGNCRRATFKAGVGIMGCIHEANGRCLLTPNFPTEEEDFEFCSLENCTAYEEDDEYFECVEDSMTIDEYAQQIAEELKEIGKEEEE